MSDLSPTRLAGVVYVLYFLVAAGGGALARGDLAALARGLAGTPATIAWVASTAVHAGLVVLLARLVWDVDPRIAVAATAMGLLGCVIQAAASLLGLGHEGPIAALFCFGVFMVLYGSLMLRSSTVPSLIGTMFIVAGTGSPRSGARALAGRPTVRCTALADPETPPLPRKTVSALRSA